MNPSDLNHPDEADLFLDGASESPRPGLHAAQLHALLRGRYHWALGLGLLLAIAGGFAGYFSQGKVYLSSSDVQLSPIQQQILTGRGDDSIARFFDSWVSLQLVVIRSPRVLEPAMASDAWQDVAYGAYKSSPVIFAQGVVLSRKRGEQIIKISYEAPDPVLAQAAVNAITQSYKTELQKSEVQSDSQTLRVLENHRLKLENEMEVLQANKRELTTEHNERTIGSVLERMTKTRDDLKSELQLARLKLANMGVTTSDDPQATDQFTLEQLASQDPQLAALLREKTQLERSIAYKRGSGQGEKHRDLRAAIVALDTLNAEIEKQARSLRNAYDGSWTTDGEASEVVSPVLVLKARVKELSALYEDAQAQTQHLGRIDSEIQNLAVDTKRVDDDLAKTVARIEGLHVEGEAQGRAQIITEGGLPTNPSNTGKRKQLAALGGMGGLFAGFALVLALAMMDRKLRHFEDAQTGLGQTRMLGVLPELPDNLTDPQQTMMASHCVHHIRTLLQIDRGQDGFVLTITGPAAGSGKTSLTMALGMSFATSGSNTLMIDCDIVGGGLTRHMLEADQAAHDAGVLEACNGTVFDDCVVKTSIPNLSILPIGSALPSQAGVLSPAAIEKLLAKARSAYDTILVDTGPVLGSLEASMASAQADKTIVIVSRGDRKPIVSKSLEHLRSIGASIAGIVFNHADEIDIERSTYASVTVSQSRREDDTVVNGIHWIDPDTSSRYGPLASAVASYGQRKASGDEEHS